MKTIAEKRVCERHSLTADIAFSYFNSEHSYDAQVLNLGTDGMCFKSNFRPQLGATLCIRVKKIHPNNAGPRFYEGLRTVTLAEVKWCEEITGTGESPYGIGVKYFAAAY